MRGLSFSSLLFFIIFFGEKMSVLSKGFDVYWRDYNGTIPTDAFPTGHDVYIAQIVVSQCGLVPGTLYPRARIAVSEAGFKRVKATKNIKILCTRNPDAFYWAYITIQQLSTEMLENCVVGGFESDGEIFIGKSFHEGEWKIGKVLPPTSPYKGLRLWQNSGGGSFPTDFQILRGS